MGGLDGVLSVSVLRGCELCLCRVSVCIERV